MTESTKQFIRILFICLFIQPISTEAQLSDTSKPVLHKQNFSNLIVYKKPGADSMVDFIDVLHAVFRPAHLKKDSIGKEQHGPDISFVPGVLYSLSTGVAVSVNTNATFHSKNEKNNLSNLFANINYTQKKQAILQLVSDIWTKNNEYNINTNWSYLKYPQQDFGLGGYSSLDLIDQLDYSYIRLYQSVLKKIAPDIYIGPGINLDYHWNITDTSTINKPVYGAMQYGLPAKSNTAGFVVTFLYDTRKNIVNPVPGSSLINLVYRDNVTWLGSNQHSQALLIEARKYVKLSAVNNNLLAFWTYNWLTLSGQLPYLDLPSTGWDTYNNTGRGYIQGRFRGTQMLYFESEYRFGITENGLLGAVIFANAQSFSESPGGQIKTIAPGYGSGIRVKFNKHSNTNLSIDYGFGKGGSRGLFMNLGEFF